MKKATHAALFWDVQFSAGTVMIAWSGTHRCAFKPCSTLTRPGPVKGHAVHVGFIKYIMFRCIHHDWKLKGHYGKKALCTAQGWSWYTTFNSVKQENYYKIQFWCRVLSKHLKLGPFFGQIGFLYLKLVRIPLTVGGGGLRTCILFALQGEM